MKTRIIFTSLFAIMLFAGLAEAQVVKVYIAPMDPAHPTVMEGTRLPAIRAAIDRNHTKLLVGNDQSIVRSGAPTSSSELPTLNLTAGQSIRIQVVVRKDEEQDDIISGSGTGAQPHVKTTATPCESVQSTSVRKAGGDRQEYLTIKFADLLVSSTQRSWKNTCRLLTVTLLNGDEYRARLRFQ